MVLKHRTFFLEEDDDVNSADHHPSNQRAMEPGRIRSFSLEELEAATGHFSSSRTVGSGGYRGVLPDGSVVAVKRQYYPIGAQRQATSKRSVDVWEMQFTREIEIGMMAHHPNLLPLLGFCSTTKEKCLVYPFIQYGSAASKLEVLDWPSRERIALGLARALSHLHDSCASMIVHLDVKPANVLLGDDFEPLLADFGFAALMVKKPTELLQSAGPPNQEIVNPYRDVEEEEEERRSSNSKRMRGVSCSYWSSDAADDSRRSRGLSCWYWSSTIGQMVEPTHTMINMGSLDFEKQGFIKWEEFKEDYRSHTYLAGANIRGTYPYIAPEYLRERRCSEKADVYGYGITILELVGENVSSRPYRGVLKKRLENLCLRDVGEDPKLKLMAVALLCTQRYPEHRPTMTEVTGMLEIDALGFAAKWGLSWHEHGNYQDELNMSLDSWFVDSTEYQVSDYMPIAFWSVDSTEYQVSEELSSPR